MMDGTAATDVRTRFLTILAAFVAMMMLCAPAALAASPDLRSVNPPGGQRGTEVELDLRGLRLEKAQELYFYEPGIEVVKITPDEKSPDRRVLVTVKIAPDARLGQYHLRLRTATGLTNLHTFWVGHLPIIQEKEPNTDFDKPQAIEPGHTIQGVIENEDIDYFVIDAKKGQRITMEAEAIRLGRVLFDPALAILKTNRFELTSADDTTLLSQDCYVSAIAPEDGKYILAIRDSSYTGNGSFVYRLHIGDMPRPTAVYPPGGQAGQSVDFQFLGDPTGTFAMNVKLPEQPVEMFDLYAVQDGKMAPSPNPIRVSAFPNVLEAEPNNDGGKATAHSGGLPVAFNGIIESAGDVDLFRFTAKKGESPRVRVFARTLGSPLDPVLEVLDAKGKAMKANDDSSGNLDSSVDDWSAPEDGEYLIRIKDQLGKGGHDYVYRIELDFPTPSLRFSIPEVGRDDTQTRQWIAVPKGNRWVSLFRASRGGVGGELEMIAKDMPAGITMHAPKMASNVNDIPIIFEAAADAPIAGKLIDLQGKPTDGKRQNAKYEGRYAQRVMLVSGPPNRTPYYTSEVERIAAAVIEEAPFHVRLETPKTPILQSGAMNLKVVVDRKEGYDEEINVQLPFRPPGISARSQVTISKGKNEAEYPINANGNAAVGEWDIAVAAYGTVDGGQMWVASELTKMSVAPAVLRGSIQMAVTEQGSAIPMLVKLDQKEEFEGTAKLVLLGLPNKAAAEPVDITKETKEVTFQVTTDAVTPVGQHKSLLVQLELPKNGDTMIQTVAGGGVLRVDKPRPAPVAKADDKKDEKKPAAANAKPLSRLEALRIEREKELEGK